MRNYRATYLFVFLSALAACGDDAGFFLTNNPGAEGLETPPPVVVAVMGDYGVNSVAEAQVANLIHGWQPDFIVTTGDNNYPDGAASRLDDNIGRFYHKYIKFNPAYRGRYKDSGAHTQAFFPTLGNHDWIARGAVPYLRYFDLPGNKRYYRVARGAVEFFLVDSDPQEPDGTSPASTQGRWLKAALADSTARWKVVAFHHPPYSTGVHGGSPRMRWPFKAWGAHLVLNGHDHHYERIQKDGFPYIVVGTGGAPLRLATGRHPASEIDIIYTRKHGALRLEANAQALDVAFYNTAQTYIDGFRIDDGATPAKSLPK